MSLVVLCNQVNAQKWSALPTGTPQRTDNLVIYRPSGLPYANVRFTLAQMFALLDTSDITGLNMFWNDNGTAIYYTAGKVGIGEVAPLANLHLGNGSTTTGYGTAANGLQIGGNPLGYFNMYQNTSNQLIFGTGGTNIWYMNNTGILPATNSTYNLGSTSLYWNNIYGRNYFVDDTTLQDWVDNRISLQPGGAAGNDYEIQFNESGLLSSSANFKWNDTTLLLKSSLGTNNIAIGLNSCNAITTGSENTFIGNISGSKVTSGLRNTYLGYESGSNATSSHYNTFIGYYSGRATNTGASNTYLGSISGYSNTTGNYGVFLGYESGYKNTTASGNIYIGYQAGYNNQTGNTSVFVGYQSGYTSTLSGNTFIGYKSGETNTGSANVFLGNLAGQNEIGSNKLYIENSSSATPLIYGNFADDSLIVNGTFKTTGNLISGTRFAWNNTNLAINNGSNTISIGTSAGLGTDNVIIGNIAGAHTSTSSNSVIIGLQAGRYGSGEDNVYLGYLAGYQNTGSGNIFIGKRQGKDYDTDSILAIDVTETLAPLIYGDFANDSVVINGKLISNYYLGQLYISGDSTLVIAAIDTYYTFKKWVVDSSENVTLTDSSMTALTNGYYQVGMSSSFTHSVNNTVVHFSIFVNDVERKQIETQRKIATGGDYGNASSSGLIYLNTNDIVKVKYRSDNTGTVTVNHSNFNIVRIN